jgi:copper chaperone NosL
MNQIRMTRGSSIAMVVTAVLISAVYLFPLWEISLQAPQYPDGLGIHIWIDKITGREPHDLQNINGLNHYIGMKAIEPDSIPELKFMKFIAAALAASALLVGFLRLRWLLAIWVVVAILCSAAGMYDFYKWEYDYGHNLDPSAAIKVPGMTYQPPMFGTTKLLNFYATAWPALGGLAAMLAVGLSVLTLLYEFYWRRRKARNAGSAALKAASILLLGCTLAGCSSGPRAIEYGTDQCQFCKMTISDERYGAELVTRKGRALTYDSIECMLRAVENGDGITETGVEGWYVTDYAHQRTLVNAREATFLHSTGLPSPMGENLTAFAAAADAEVMKEARGGRVMDWEGLRLHVKGKEPAHAAQP